MLFLPNLGSRNLLVMIKGTLAVVTKGLSQLRWPWFWAPCLWLGAGLHTRVCFFFFVIFTSLFYFLRFHIQVVANGVFLFLTYLVRSSRVASTLLQMASFFFLFYDWVVHCVYVARLIYPLICHRATLRFPFIFIVNSAAVNTCIGVHISFWVSVFFSSDKLPRSGLAG